MLVQDFTACGLGGMHGPRVDGIPNTERRVGQSLAYKLEAHSGLSLQCFSWNTFSCGNKAVKWWFGSPANRLFNPGSDGPSY